MTITYSVIIQDKKIFSSQREVEEGECWSDVLANLVDDLYVQYGTWATVTLTLSNSR